MKVEYGRFKIVYPVYYLSDLPPCDMRFGRGIDKKAVMFCNDTIITPSECVACKGYTDTNGYRNASWIFANK